MDIEGDSEVSEWQPMGSEDLMRNREEGRRDHTIQDEQTRRQEDLEEEINSLWYRVRCEIRENHWKRTGSGVDVARCVGVPAHWTLRTSRSWRQLGS